MQAGLDAPLLHIALNLDGGHGTGRTKVLARPAADAFFRVHGRPLELAPADKAYRARRAGALAGRAGDLVRFHHAGFVMDNGASHLDGGLFLGLQRRDGPCGADGTAGHAGKVAEAVFKGHFGLEQSRSAVIGT